MVAKVVVVVVVKDLEVTVGAASQTGSDVPRDKIYNDSTPS